MDMPVTAACITQARGRRLGRRENHQQTSAPIDPPNAGGANTNDVKLRVEVVVTMPA
jgi:hypothetical protein